MIESRRGHRCLSLLRVVFCQVEVSAMDRSLVKRSRTEYVYVCVCVCVCVSLRVVRCDRNLLHLQSVGRIGQTEKE
jgi:hypothetical protein